MHWPAVSAESAIRHRVQVVQQLRELEQPLCRVTAAAAGDCAVQLLDVGRPQVIKTALVFQTVWWN